MAVDVIVSALGAGAAQAEPYFQGPWAGEWRNDWEGDIGFAFVAAAHFAVAGLGRLAEGGAPLAEAADVMLWSADSQEVVAQARVGPAAPVIEGYALEALPATVMLRKGKEYRLTQRCAIGMRDRWLDSRPSLEQAESQSRFEVARPQQGVYNFFLGYPSFEDGDLRRCGMLNFTVVPSIASLTLQPTTLVREIKASLEKTLNVPPMQQRLICGAKVLEDAASVADCAIADGAGLLLELQPGAFLATASRDGTARLWGLDSGDCQQIYSGHTAAVLDVAFSPSGEQLATASADRTARLWHTESGACQWTLEGHSDGLRSVRFAPVRPLLLTASDDHTARLWNADLRTCVAELCGHLASVVCACFTSDGQTVVTASCDGSLKVWSTEDAALLRTMSGHGRSATSLAISQDDASALSTSVGTSIPVALWRLEDGQCAQVFGEGMQAYQACLAPDGSRVLTACADYVVRLWDVETGECLLELRHETRVLNSAFSIDGRVAATVAGDFIVRLWDLSDGRCAAETSGHSALVSTLAFLPNGASLVSASEDGTAKVWDAVTGGCIRILAGHDAGIVAAAVSP